MRASTYDVAPFSLLSTSDEPAEVRRKAARLCGVKAAEIEDAFPCTPLQEGLLALTARQAGYYVARHVVELRASIESFRAVWNSVVATTPILRTRVVNLTGEKGLTQVIVDEPMVWTMGATLEEYVKTDERWDMGLGTPLSRYGIIDNGRCKFFVWTAHHALYDFHSVPLLMSRVIRTYRGESLTAIPPFQGFIRHIASMDTTRAEKRWQRHLDGLEAEPFPSLPTKAYQVRPDATVTHAITALQWPESGIVAASTAIRAAWAIVIAKYVGADKALFGVTTMGRQCEADVPGIAEMIGPTMATMPVRVSLDNNASTAQFLNSVQEESLEMADVEQLGMQRIRQISEKADRACQFQTLVDVHLPKKSINASSAGPFDPASAALVTAADSPLVAPLFSTYALKVQCIPEGNGLDCLLIFDSGVLSTDQVRRIAYQFEHALRQLCASENATKRLKDIEFISPQDLEQILTWNAVAPKAIDACVQDVIARTTRQQPTAPAVHAWDGDLTYAELDRLSTRLARYLVSIGTRRDTTIVPLYFDKSMWTSVAILGVMKAGGASVTLDSTQPEAHLQRIVQQTSQTIILSSANNQARAKQLMPTGQVVVPEHILPVIASATAGLPSLPKLCSSDKLYVVFTSGSTGTPKGVVVTHSNFSTAAYYQKDLLGITSNSRVYDYVSYAFDVSWLNALLTLIAGACLCVPSEEERQGDIAASIRRLGVNYADLTPSITRLIEPSSVPSLQSLTFGGEEVLAEDVARWSALQSVVNGYGPAECTPKSMTYNYISGASKQANCIGKGAGLNVWVVEPDNDKLAAIGSIGELWLEGPLVAAGYLGAPEKTAAAFIDDPPWLLHATQGRSRHGRLYKTGDLVRYNSEDGELTYIKRKDAQVKIRGQRVELADIEHHIRSVLGNDITVVAEMVSPQGSDHKVLAAFLALPGTREEDHQSHLAALTRGVVEQLKERVPAYMIPGAYIPLARIPTNISGKADRCRMRDIGSRMTLEELATYNITRNKQQRRAPTTSTEQRLQALWAATLGIAPNSIRLDDSFLQVGGDSIAAMRLVAAARGAGLSLTVSDIFRKPVLCDLAMLVGDVIEPPAEDIAPFSLLSVDSDPEEVRRKVAALCTGVKPSQVQDAFPCTPLQEGMLALSARRRGDYVPQFVFALRASVATESDAFKEAWSKVAASTPILRTRMVDLPGQGLTQVIVDDEPLEWATSESLKEYLEIDQKRETGLGTPLVRYGLINDPENKQPCFVWTLHHALYDGWSMPLVLDRLQKVYLGEESLPSPPPFQAFVKHIADINGDGVAEKLWHDHFDGLEAPSFPPLPSLAYQPRANQTLSFSMDNLQWPSDGITPSTAVRAALSVLIMQYTGEHEALFGLTTIGRQANVPGIEDFTGPTMATMPVRVSLNNKEATVGQFLHHVQQEAIELNAVEQVGLQRMRRYSADCERASRFQTLLVVQPKGQQTFKAGGPVERMLTDRTTSGATHVAEAFNTYALMLECTLDTNALSCEIAFDSNILAATQVQRMRHQLEHIIRQVCAPGNATKRFAEIEIDFISPQDLESIWTWNSNVPETLDECMHDLIMATSHRLPTATPAICAWDGDLSYGELNHLSEQLAHHLMSCGVGRGVTIPLCFEKSMWTSVAILGVMKAGAASVTLDLTLPEERLQSIVSQVPPALILCSARNERLAATLTTKQIIVVDRTGLAQLPSLASSRTLPTVNPSDTLYTVFTSGSTGIPKGTSISHQNFCSALRHQQQALAFSDSTQVRAYNFASYSFDVAWYDVLRMFATGGCLCVPSESERKNDLSGSFERLRANSLSTPPSVARLIEPRSVPGLKQLIMGGEAATVADVARWAEQSVDVYNVYGPAECVPLVTLAHCDVKSGVPPNLGKARGANVWLVDPTDHTRLPFIGAVGECLIEGPLVGQGYLGNKELTDKAFVRDPAWLLRGTASVHGRHGRLYKTGDLMKYGEDGSLTFVGRKDAQVKINSQRVELAEIEQHIRNSMDMDRDVQLAAEVLQPGDGKRAVLVTFYSLSRGSVTAQGLAKIQRMTAQWNDRLMRKIPAYMVPSAYVPLEGFPMTATGKTDRRRLRLIGNAMTLEELAELNPTRSKRGNRYVPSSIIELRLQALWASTLGIDANNIRLDDSFLQIGGDSVTAMRLVTAARKEGLSLNVTDIFDQPDLCSLASVTRTTSGADEPEAEILPFSLLSRTDDNEDVRDKAAALCGVQPAQVQDAFPCTPLQEGLLALTAARQSGHYVARRVMELCASVNSNAFQAAWKIVVMTTPVLRTRIVNLADHGLTQVVLDESLDWTIGDNLEEYIKLDKKRDRGLGTPLASYGLIAGRYFVWTMHHALYDGWSIPLLIERLKIAYSGSVMPSLPPFQMFIKSIVESDKERAKAFWQDYLNGVEAQPFPALPTVDYQPRANMTTGHSIRGMRWSLSGVTASTMVRAAWSILATQYTGATEVTFGATVTGRQNTIPRIEQIIGPTITTVPIRIVMKEHQNLGEFLHQIQKQMVEMTAVEHMGLQQIRKINLDADQACQFQTLLVVQPAARDAEKDNDLFNVHETSEWGSDQANAFNTYGLQLICNLTNDGAHLEFSFDSNLIKKLQVQRMGQQLEHVLRQVHSSNNWTKKLAQIATVCKQDLHDIWTWNSTLPDTVETCMHDVIAKVSHRQPTAEAVCAWDGKLTYEELDQLSTRLAHHLVSLGIRRDITVPLCFEKSMWMPVAQVAVMKAGGASVGIDVRQPEERIRAILKQIEPIVVLCSSARRESASLLGDCAAVVVVDKATSASLDDPTGPSAQLPTVSPSDMLYVVFTSGSTGTPKGAIITHRNFSSAIYHQRRSLRIEASTRLYDFVSYAFDVSWANLLHTLTAGGCLCIPSEGDRQSRIAESMQSLRVNYAHLTPTVARLVDPSTVPGLRILQLSGESLLKADRARWTPYVTLLNTYGPAECSVTSTCEDMVRDDRDPPRIGRAIGGNAWVVRSDSFEDLVPIGCIGELVLEGPLVGSGYLADHEKTAAAFIENPPWLQRGGPGCPGRTGRLYKTGDLVRSDHDGGLTFVGRVGTQVKIRGQRVELGDVEHHVHHSLASGAKARVVAEVVTPRQSNNPMLVAFVDVGENAVAVPQASVRSITDGLSERLARVVPAYMIPSAYIPLVQVPVTATGKTDRRRLRLIGESMTLEELAELNPTRNGYRAPRNTMEKRLQELWASTLGISAASIGIDDNFLQIGGDSVTAMRLVAAVQDQGLSLTVTDVFRHPVLCDLAAAIGVTKVEKPEVEIEPFSLLAMGQEEVRSTVAALCGVQPAQVHDTFPCTPLQEGLLALTARRTEDWVARHVIALRSSVACKSFQDAWSQVVATTPILRTRIVDFAGGLTQVIVDEPVEWVIGNHLDEYIERDRRQEIGLGTPLTRYGLINDRQTKQRFFVWTIHHALYDGWSVPLIIKRAQKAYLGEPLLAPPPFQSFVKHIISYQKDHTEKLWKEYFDGLEAQPFPPIAASYEPKADKTVTHTVTDLQWPKTNVTASTAIRTAWAVLIAKYLGSEEALFGVATIGRQASVPKIAEIIGPTIATIPVRVCLGKSTVSELLHRVQEQSIEMTTVEQLGLQRLRRVSPDAERACQFQTLLDVQPRKSQQPEDDLVHAPNGLFDPLSATRASGEATYISAAAFSAHALKVLCKPDEDGLDCLMTFDDQVLSSNQIQRMAFQFEHILRQLCAPQNATRYLADITFTSPQDLCDIWAWNATVPDTVDIPVHDLITEKARVQPKTPAICAWDGDLSYEQLERLSTHLACELHSFGIQDAIVPIYFEKSMWTSVAIQGVMKAGGVCVTLDATQPLAHLERIVQQTSRTVILSSIRNETLAKRLIGKTGQVVVPEHLLPSPSNILLSTVSIAAEILPKVDPSDRLYVVFTSGSTGTPKGVVVTHSNFSTAAFTQQEALGVTSKSRVYDYVSYAFDVSWLNALLTLVAGACLCVPSEEDRQGDIAASIRRLKVTHADLTPSITRLIEPSDVPSLRQLNFGGEAVLAEDARRWTARGDINVVNTYGPAECTPKSTAYNYTLGSSKAANLIGRGIGLNAWVVELHNNDKLAVIGGVGELWLEGPLVSAGYLGEPEKTAAAFIKDPPWLLSRRHGRLYKTGDLVQYNDDGSMTYISRKDSQVKIRGQRVELADIEHHIRKVLGRSVPDADLSVVAEMITLRGSENKILVAFLAMPSICKEEGAYRSKLVRLTSDSNEQLKERVPAYMIPSAFMPLASIPMSATGKTDRRRLREMGSAMTLEQLTSCNSENRERRPPITAAERQLQALWASTLKIEADQIGLDDSFMQIGGDSIAAMRLVGMARMQGLSLKVADVFKQPRLGDLSAVVKDLKVPVSESQTSTSAGAETRKASFHLTSEVLSQVRDIHALPSDMLPVTNFQRLCIQGALRTPKTWWDYRYVDFPPHTEAEKLVRCCHLLWDQFDILRTVFLCSQGRYLQVVPRESEPTIVVRETDDETHEDATRMCVADEATPTELGTCFTRFFITRSTRGPTRLTFRLSHAQYDDVSYQVIMKSLRAAFQGEQAQPVPQFADFVRHGIDHGVATFHHWRSLLDGSTMTSVPSSRMDSNNGKGIEVTRVTSLRPSTNGVTPATTFTAACACALAKVVKTSDVAFGRVVSGRPVLGHDMQHVVGACVGFVPVRITFDGAPSMETAEAAVQTQYVEGLSHETIGLAGGVDGVSSEDEVALTNVGCFAHFQNGDANPTEQVDQTSCRLEFYERSEVRVDPDTNRVDILARPHGKDLKITVTSGSHERSELDAVLREVCMAMEQRP